MGNPNSQTEKPLVIGNFLHDVESSPDEQSIERALKLALRPLPEAQRLTFFALAITARYLRDCAIDVEAFVGGLRRFWKFGLCRNRPPRTFFAAKRHPAQAIVGSMASITQFAYRNSA